MDTQESLRRKLSGAEDLKSVVRTMKAVAASNIGQYETAVRSLGDYYQTVSLGIVAYLGKEKSNPIIENNAPIANKDKVVCALVFGSDQGLVGRFNDSLAEFVSQSLQEIEGRKEIWAVGERVQLLLSDMGYDTAKTFSVPGSVNAITPLVEKILVQSEAIFNKNKTNEIYIFHNQPLSGAAYKPAMQRLLPLDEKWRQSYTAIKWPTKRIPQLIGGNESTLLALIHAYLFTSLFKGCAESLASENASRLAAMQRAEKNIGELLEELSLQFHSLRQSTIDEELFDVVSGFEVMKED
ncbi:F0F1 ATP synthase subunit gamma [Flavobacterium crassostreae]|uniref:F0F1 ATP synthase subunit gamma n=1 Tax=Flavobacterium crassostreae TaxID=1763534 RepID=A0A1B9E993_9FLAO|nr:F0F1 ATP synthase subunit gamma [Flavobacterium crassostreae]OCB78514.1 F0F1 ATP synthase subunit gamma [Flavobacterium crassostreae]